jgi:hypothetical protein
MWILFIWFRLGTRDGLLWTWKSNFRFYTRRGILYWLHMDSSGVSYAFCIWVYNPFALSEPVVSFPDRITRISASITASQGGKKDTSVVREKEKHRLGSWNRWINAFSLGQQAILTLHLHSTSISMGGRRKRRRKKGWKNCSNKVKQTLWHLNCPIQLTSLSTTVLTLRSVTLYNVFV